MMRRVIFGSLVAVGGLAFVGCALALDGYSGPPVESVPPETSTLGTADAMAEASIPADVGVDATGNGCVVRPGVGAPMVRVLDAGFCIDKTEVKLDQYVEFYADKPTPPAPCAWKTEYTAPPFKGNSAIETAFKYPYGTHVNPQICLYSDSPDSGRSRRVASNPSCVGPADVFDMSANVWEWEDACDRSTTDTDPGAQCNLRGGGFLRDSSWGACAVVPGGWDRNSHVADTGIRCCSDFTP